MPTQRPAPTRAVPSSRLRGPLVAAACAALVFAVGVLWSRAPGKSPSVASAPVAEMVDLSPPRPAAVHPVGTASAALAPSASAVTPASSKPARPAR